MILEELLEVINDNMIVKLYIDTEEVACYDGKDSIDDIYNNCQVFDVWTDIFSIDHEHIDHVFIGIDISEP